MVYFYDIENTHSLLFQGFSLKHGNCKFRFLIKWLFESDGIVFIEIFDTGSVSVIIFAI